MASTRLWRLSWADTFFVNKNPCLPLHWFSFRLPRSAARGSTALNRANSAFEWGADCIICVYHKWFKTNGYPLPDNPSNHRALGSHSGEPDDYHRIHYHLMNTCRGSCSLEAVSAFLFQDCNDWDREVFFIVSLLIPSQIIYYLRWLLIWTFIQWMNWSIELVVCPYRHLVESKTTCKLVLSMDPNSILDGSMEHVIWRPIVNGHLSPFERNFWQASKKRDFHMCIGSVELENFDC